MYGWIYDGQNGDHRHYKHPSKPGKVTIPVGNKELAKKQLTAFCDKPD